MSKLNNSLEMYTHYYLIIGAIKLLRLPHLCLYLKLMMIKAIFTDYKFLYTASGSSAA